MPNKKYLTESKLGTILKNIYPNNIFIHDNTIAGSKNKRSRPDYFCADLKLIVEFDGPLHYTSSKTILRDQKKDENYLSEGYRIIRIPYFTQMCPEIAKLMFNVPLKTKQAFPHGFVDEYVVMPSDYCELGIQRFIKDLEIYSSVKEEVVQSLKDRIVRCKEINAVLPPSLHYLVS